MTTTSITLRCGCSVTQEGAFQVGERCKHCHECNTISKTHPFGEERL
ncbi:hypothetical protein HYS47_04395 [Candidatus Woesearchaeota archaeon]|nr:hypothetical protein [Candidatus Woesearchaeota archaeon]